MALGMAYILINDNKAEILARQIQMEPESEFDQTKYKPDWDALNRRRNGNKTKFFKGGAPFTGQQPNFVVDKAYTASLLKFADQDKLTLNDYINPERMYGFNPIVAKAGSRG